MSVNKGDIAVVRAWRWLLISVIAVVLMAAAVGPALGYLVDTRVYPGNPDTQYRVSSTDSHGNTNVNYYTDDEDTVSWVWFLGYIGTAILFGAILGPPIYRRIESAKHNLGMRTVMQPIPGQKQLVASGDIDPEEDWTRERFTPRASDILNASAGRRVR